MNFNCDVYRFLYPITVLVLILCAACLVSSTNENELSGERFLVQVEEQCRSYMHLYNTDIYESKDRKIIELQENVFQLQQKDDNNKALIKSFKSRIVDLHKSIDFHQKTIEQQLRLSISIKSELDTLATIKCELLQKELIANSVICHDQITNLTSQLQSNDNLLKTRNESEDDKKSLSVDEHDQEPSICCESPSCVPSAHIKGVNKLKVNGSKWIDVLCDDDIDDYGWTVIQKRFDGQVDFYRDWDSYSNGFGDINGEFFLGLKWIHCLTSSRQHELLIHMESLDGNIENARYDNFTIGSESEQYKLISLGQFSGSAAQDRMSYITNMNFTTFDRDNDSFKLGNCAEHHHGGWWYEHCGTSNLNGKMYGKAYNYNDAMFWSDNQHSLKKVTMLIRPVDFYA